MIPVSPKSPLFVTGAKGKASPDSTCQQPHEAAWRSRRRESFSAGLSTSPEPHSVRYRNTAWTAQVDCKLGFFLLCSFHCSCCFSEFTLSLGRFWPLDHDGTAQRKPGGWVGFPIQPGGAEALCGLKVNCFWGSLEPCLDTMPGCGMSASRVLFPSRCWALAVLEPTSFLARGKVITVPIPPTEDPAGPPLKTGNGVSPCTWPHLSPPWTFISWDKITYLQLGPTTPLNLQTNPRDVFILQELFFLAYV